MWFVGEDGVESELPKTASGKVQKHILREWGTKWAKQGVGKVGYFVGCISRRLIIQLQVEPVVANTRRSKE